MNKYFVVLGCVGFLGLQSAMASPVCETKKAIWDENIKLREFKNNPQKFYIEQTKSQKRVKEIMYKYYKNSADTSVASQALVAAMVDDSCGINLKQLNRQ